MRTILMGALWLALVAPGAGAQQAAMPDAYRQTQMKMLALQRSMLLAMADSMPEALYRDKATPEQRDFAQQLQHCALAMAFLGVRYMGGERPALPDTAVALNSRAGLKQYINATFDYAAERLKTQSAESRAEAVEFFGQTIPRWQVWDELHQHTIWTAGQVVANFRKHGMAPPGFGFF
ncbi:MAG: DinB family protein [Gemmatimonadota bacterium]|nr:DinB family protein [Gemmatimonadota bacterium]